MFFSFVDFKRLALLIGAGLIFFHSGEVLAVPPDDSTPPADFITSDYQPFKGIKLKDRRFVSGGTKIHFVEAGRGDSTVVFLHGFADFWYGWREQIAALAGHYRVVAVDLPGFNLSEPGRGIERYTAAAITADLNNLLKELNIDRAYFVGHDLGGWLAWQFAMAEPGKTAGLVAVNSPHPLGFLRELRHNPLQKKASAYIEDYRENRAPHLSVDELTSWVGERRDQEPYRKAMGRSHSEAMMGYYAAADIGMSERTTKKIRSPVLLVQGLDDEQIMPDTLNGTWNWIDAPMTLITLPGVHHDAHRERAGWFNRTLLNWLDELESGRFCRKLSDENLRVCVQEISESAVDGYRLKTIDIDGDGHPDIIHIGGPLKWISSMDHKSYVMTDPTLDDNIDIAANHSERGLQVAVASHFNFTSKNGPGKLFLFTPEDDVRKPWHKQLIDSEPTLHRLQWMDLAGNGEMSLVGSTLFGAGATGIGLDQPPGLLLRWDFDSEHAQWNNTVIDRSLHGIHAMEPVDWNAQRRADVGPARDLILASVEGLTLFRSGSKGKSWEKISLASGDQSRKSVFGSGEVAIGYRKNQGKFLAAIEPWHGDQVSIYQDNGKKWQRQVIDRGGSSGGHSILTLDPDGSGNDRVLACFFGRNPGIYLYSRDKDRWKKTKIIGEPFDCECLQRDPEHQRTDVLAISDVSHRIIRLSFIP